MFSKGQPKILFVVAAFVLAGFFLSADLARAEIVYSWDWEDPNDPWGGWSPHNGVWQVGEPTSAPITAYSPINCASTILDGYYPKDTDSRLESPDISLRSVGPNEEVILRFWHWFAYSREHYDDDEGRLEISVWNNGTWSAWDTLETYRRDSGTWTPRNVPLDSIQYGGKRVRISFFLVEYSDSWGHHENAGWYVDDFEVHSDSGYQPPELDIKANGEDGKVRITASDNLSVTVELDSGDYAGKSVELWLGALTIYGNQWCDPSGNWSAIRTPYFQGALNDIPSTVVLNQTVPAGVYTLFFVMDNSPDGIFNVTLCDLVNVICKRI